jgi:hypothetical protein
MVSSRCQGIKGPGSRPFKRRLEAKGEILGWVVGKPEVIRLRIGPDPGTIQRGSLSIGSLLSEADLNLTGLFYGQRHQSPE